MVICLFRNQVTGVRFSYLAFVTLIVWLTQIQRILDYAPQGANTTKRSLSVMSFAPTAIESALGLLVLGTPKRFQTSCRLGSIPRRPARVSDTYWCSTHDPASVKAFGVTIGRLAQLGERSVYTRKVAGSSPASSTEHSSASPHPGSGSDVASEGFDCDDGSPMLDPLAQWESAAVTRRRSLVRIQ